MRINLLVKPGWILQRMAQEIASRVPHVKINAGKNERFIDPTVDATYYFPAKDIRKYPVHRGLKIGFFTHGVETLSLVPQFDACVAMNRQMADALREAGAKRVTVIRPGTDMPMKPIVFGVVGRVYNNGRKGENLVRQAVKAGYRFVACGTDTRTSAMTSTQWHCPQTHVTKDRAAFYKSIDYLVITSLDEGGPIPLIEAVAHGVPVIAPDVGWCWEYSVLGYDRGDWDSLNRVLFDLTHVPTWDQWATQHQALFSRLASPDLQAEVAC